MGMRFLSRLRRDEGGVAAVEFALWSVAFFLAIMAALDIGSIYLQRGKMNEAVGAAAVASFSSADNVDFAQLPDYVRSLTGNPSLSVSTSCNGVQGSCTNFSRTCACLKTDGSYVTATCGNVCTGADVTSGSTAGYYLTVDASDTFEPTILPQGVFSGQQISQAATIRLQ